jgi:hypothetical protein
MTMKISDSVKPNLITEDYGNGYLMLKHLEALYRPNTEWAMMIVFAELRSLTPDGMALEDYLDKLKSLIERINRSGIELMSEKRSLLVMIMRFSKLHTHEAMAEVWTTTGRNDDQYGDLFAEHQVVPNECYPTAFALHMHFCLRS